MAGLNDTVTIHVSGVCGLGMCGIAGIIDLRQERPVNPGALARMARSLLHRGPDEEGYFLRPGIGMACRRLSIVGVSDGRQPLFNETRSVVAVINGELFDYPELGEQLRRRGHKLRSHSDSELIVHLWEEYGEEMFAHLRGQFAFALLDLRQRRLVLGRDRFGICPLHWTRQGDWLIFGSEIKAVLASALAPRAPDPKGLDNIFTFFCMPGRRTAFEGIQAVLPGHFLRFDFGDAQRTPAMQEKTYWDFAFPDQGEEENPRDAEGLVSTFDELLGQAVSRRLRADVPVAGYLSGGVDSTLVTAKARGSGNFGAVFTARMGDLRLDESSVASRTARDLGCEHHIVNCGQQTLIGVYPQVVTAADCPVVDPNAGSLFELSRAVHEAGYKAVLTGEGADEALAGYVWFKVHRFFRAVGWHNVQPLVWGAEKLYQHEYTKAGPNEFQHINALLGGLHAQTLVYHLTSRPRWLLLRDEFRAEIGRETAYAQLEFDTARIRRWHPLNRSLYMGYKTQLPGLLLNHRGDRVTMANSVEARYPFLDESLLDLCCKLAPQWKLRGWSQDKYLLRRAAMRSIPRQLATRRKAMFRAPFSSLLLAGSVPYTAQLLSRESLQKTEYFSPGSVSRMIHRVHHGRPSLFQFFDELALSAVVGTQLWHHLFLGGGLCELPSWQPPAFDEMRLPQMELV